MNYKFKVGELVKVNGSLALVIGRCREFGFADDELYTLLLSDGERVEAISHSLTKVGEK